MWAMLCILAVALAQEPAVTTAPSLQQMIAGGELLYTPPPVEWKSLGKTGDDLSMGYAPANHDGQIVLVVVREPQPIPDSLAPRLGTQFCQTIHNESQKGNIQTIMPPRVEQDKRFLLKIHDQFKSHGKYSDRVQLFRGIGKYLVSVTVNAFTQDADQQKKTDEIAEDVLLSVRLNRPGSEPITASTASPEKPAATTQPILFAAAHLRITSPSDWQAQPTNQPSGLLITWRDPASDTNVITLTYRTVLSQPSDDPAVMDMAIDQLAAAEKPVVESTDAKALGPTQPIADKRFLRKISTDYQLNDAKLRVSMRQVRAGDGVVSITSIATADRADEIDTLADQVAMDVRATR